MKLRFMLTSSDSIAHRWHTVRNRGGLGLAALALALASCSSVKVSTPEEFARFEAAGPYTPTIDIEALTSAKLETGPYRVAADDVLSLDMPDVIRALSPQADDSRQFSQDRRSLIHRCRVTQQGTITLPVVGEIPAAGKTLGEIEQAAVAAYHPKYVVHRPSVVAEVTEYSVVHVTVMGAVENPGIYALTSRERSLVGALMKAGGIGGTQVRAGGIITGGASAVRVRNRGTASDERIPPVVLPVTGVNLPFTDLPLTDGATVEVIGLDPQVFTFVGLVTKPGTYAYPPGAKYSLLHALGFAGGIDPVSDPHYVQVYRQDASGEIVMATYNIYGPEGMTRAAGVEIRNGDILHAARTPRTEARRLISGLFRGGLFFGATYDLGDN